MNSCLRTEGLCIDAVQKKPFEVNLSFAILASTNKNELELLGVLSFKDTFNFFSLHIWFVETSQ